MKLDIWLCGIILGLKPQKLEIMAVGFAISFKVDTKNYNKKILKANLLSIKKLAIALAGPVVNLIFIAIFLLLNKSSILIYVNILIFIFNMITIYPLDGGRILKYITYLFLNKSKALYVTNIVSNVTAVIITICIIYISILLKNISYIFVLIYIWLVLIQENQKYKIKRKMYKILENYIAINQD